MEEQDQVNMVTGYEDLPFLKKITDVDARPFDDKKVKGMLFFMGVFAIIALFFIILFLLREAIPFLTKFGIFDMLFGQSWHPHKEPIEYGAAPIIYGTFCVTFGSIIFSVPLGILCAIFIAEIAPPKVRTVLKTGVELLAGIPSVVYGFFGLRVLVDWLRVAFDRPTGDSWLAASILLGIMALPTIVTVAEDAISAVPREYKEASLAMGATKWQTISKVIVPSAISGITAAVILGTGRAIGETMAVMMVAGNTAKYPDPLWDIFDTVRTITGNLGIETREVPFQSDWYSALFTMAVILFIITLVINSLANVVLKRMNEKFNPSEKTEKKLKKKERKRLGKGKTGPNIWDFLKRNQNRIVMPLLFTIIIIFAFLIFGLLAGIMAGILVLVFYIFSSKSNRKVSQKLWFGLIILANFIVLAALGIIIGYIFMNGIGALIANPKFCIEFISKGGAAGGILECIIGTFYLTIFSILFALPIGVLAGIYLAEYAKEGRITRIIRASIDNLNGTPSIIFGLFGMAFFVLYLQLGFSLLSGILTMGLMILPTIIRTTEEAIKSVPQELREASYAMGCSKWLTIRKVVLLSAKPGILTGAILGMGRVAGETAPIMYVAVHFIGRPNLFPMFFSTVNALPYHLYVLSTEMPGAKVNAGGTALVLLLFVMILFGIASVLRSHYEKQLQY